MAASHRSEPVIVSCRSHASRGRRAFSLVELLVVVGIIVLLIGLLLTALRQVRIKSNRTQTEATMQQFANACVAFQAEHSRYPGMLPDEVVGGYPPTGTPPPISYTENVLLELMGGARVLTPQDVGTPYETEFNAWGDPQSTIEVSYPYGTQTWKLRVDSRKIGEGPVINGKAYKPYFTPGPGQVMNAEHRPGSPQPFTPLAGNTPISIPDLVDAWENPIILLRQARTRGTLIGLLPASPTSAPNTQFYVNGLNPYLASDPGATSLIDLYQGNQADALAVITKVVEHPTVPNAARGAICLVSAGADGIFYSNADGPGSSSDPIDATGTVTITTLLANPKNFDEFDDVRVFAGG